MSEEPSESSVVRYAAEHPVVTGIFATCIVVGGILGAMFLAEDWSLARRIAAAGAGIALLTTAPRIVG